MSNIPQSKRTETKADFFVKANMLRKLIVSYLAVDFGENKMFLSAGVSNSDYWIIEKVRNAIYQYAQDMIGNITQANTIYITNFYEYNERRRYMTAAIGNCEQILQEIQFAILDLKIKPDKYVKLSGQIEKAEERLKAWQKSDNKVLMKLKEEKEKT